MRGPLLELLRADADGEEIAAFLAPKSPQVRTTTGEDIVACTARYECVDPGTAWTSLCAQLELQDESLLALVDAQNIVLGTVERDGTRLIVRTSSIERLRTLQGMVTVSGPDVRLLDESTRPLDSLDPEEAHGLPEPVDLDSADIEGIRRQLEERWLTDNIPALGGLTPREAAASTDSRAKLVALLDDFDWTQRRSPQPLEYDIDRLRRELGIAQS